MFEDDDNFFWIITAVCTLLVGSFIVWDLTRDSSPEISTYKYVLEKIQKCPDLRPMVKFKMEDFVITIQEEKQIDRAYDDLTNKHNVRKLLGMNDVEKD